MTSAVGVHKQVPFLWSFHAAALEEHILAIKVELTSLIFR